MLIRKNTKSFKTIVEIVTLCRDRPDREQLIRLYITKAGHTIQDRISVEGIEGESGIFYELNYQTVLNNLKSSNHQLHISDEVPGVYFFRSSSNKVWDEIPFEFDESISREFASLHDLPVMRKKGKAEKFVLSAAPSRSAAKPKLKEKSAQQMLARLPHQGPKQPDFKLKHPIRFTGLDRIVFRQTNLNKQGVLEYYNKMADVILPYLKDRPLHARLQSDFVTTLTEIRPEVLFRNREDEIPGWMRTTPDPVSKQELMTCNDREHLLVFVENGCLEFDAGHAKIKPGDLPDYIVVTIDSPDSDLSKAVEVALVAKDIVNGLKCPCFVKTDGMTGLHIYIPLDSKSKFEAAMASAEYICRLVQLKIPEQVALAGDDGNTYGKVMLDYTLNRRGKSVVAPYSLVPGQSPVVATPLRWDEVDHSLRAETFNCDTVLRRIKQAGDPFESFFKKKTNADALLERLEEYYSFLL